MAPAVFAQRRRRSTSVRSGSRRNSAVFARRFRFVTSGPIRQVFRPLAIAEVSKRLARMTGMLEVHKQRSQRGGNLFLGHEVLVDEVQPIAEQPAADEHRVLAGRFAHQTNIGVVWSRTADGAPG